MVRKIHFRVERGPATRGAAGGVRRGWATLEVPRNVRFGACWRALAGARPRALARACGGVFSVP